VSINERLKILIGALNISARAFSQTIEVSESTTRNYLDKGTKPSTDYLERIASHFTNVNLTWLITGQGEALLTEGSTPHTQTNISGDRNNVASGKNGKVIQKNYTLTDCEKERDSIRAERDSLAKQVELLHGQLRTKDALIASKEETIELLKAAFNRPN
jgi:transcriptional regulator with XRE-family HTH domain